jgi:hypothetical protein
MSFLTKSLEKRIQELHASIEAQKTELAAYEQVLALESGKPADAAFAPPAPAPQAPPVVSHKAVPAPSSPAPAPVGFSGTRTDFVAAILQARGSAGITPAEISAAFAARKIQTSKNLVYNVLSLMFKQKRVRKAAGKYFLLAPKAAAPAMPQPAKAAPVKSAPVKSAPVKSGPAKTGPAKKKGRISEEGMRRIIAATKKRWALVRAAQAKSK